VPRFRYDGDPDDAVLDDPRAHRRSRAPRRRSTSAELDVFVDERVPDGSSLSSYPAASHGPRPTPQWVITSGNALDTDHGPIKTGKEADVHLLERHDPGTGRTSWLAAKRYRGAHHRLFHRDAGYLEGRRVRRTRETRAMATRTALGRELIAEQWAATEFAALGALWSAGVPVPYPVQLDGTEILLELIGDEAHPAPRLAEVAADPDELQLLWEQCVDALLALGAAGYTHGDLSAFNVLVHDGRIVLIDLPQLVDIVINPQGREFLARDCRNLCTWFTKRGVDADAGDLEAEILAARPGPSE
jgi:RIO kinase 1